MTREECGVFLNELISLYPSILRPGMNEGRLYALWYEVLEKESFEKTHAALIKFFRADKKGFPPTAGQLFPERPNLMTDEEAEFLKKNLIW